MPYRRTRTKRTKRSGAGIWAALVITCLLLSFMLIMARWAYMYIQQFQPSDEYVAYEFGGLEKPVFFQGTLLNHSAAGSGEGLMLPLPLLYELLDPNIYYEEATDSVILTTKNKVLRFRTDQLTAMMNDKPVNLQFPVRNMDGTIYVPVQPLTELYGLHVKESKETGAVLLWKEGHLIQWGKIHTRGDETVPLRKEASIKAPYVARLETNQPVMILEEHPDGWYSVQLENGMTGHIRKASVMLDRVEQIPEIDKGEAHVPWKPLGGKINLTWEAVYNRPADPSSIEDMPGVNVVSPTWFELDKDDNGHFYVRNKADSAYVRWAHNRGYQVWALFSNSFDPDLTREMLSEYDSRMEIIRQLVHLAEVYRLQGINLDFENVYLEDKDRLTQFVREMTPFLHEQGLVVSIDVTIRGGSPMWSLFYDRARLSDIVDYMIVMTYDEHWASSPVAGSVASLPWVEKGMTDIMREDGVPASKLILGVPFYTYIWTEEVKNGQVEVSSRAAGMRTVQEIIEKYDLEPVFLEETGQHYVEYEEDGKVNKIWIEDAVSMRSRAELVRKYDFAGIASWRRGFETPDIWNVMKETLEQRP